MGPEQERHSREQGLHDEHPEQVTESSLKYPSEHPHTPLVIIAFATQLVHRELAEHALQSGLHV